jgi:hypothetical protein
MLRVRAQGRADRHPTRLHRPSGEQGVRRPPRYGSYFEVAFVPLFTQVRGETVWKIGSGSESGLRGPQEGVKEPRSAASCRQRSTVERPSAIFQTVSEGEFCELRAEGVLGSLG